MGYKLEEIEIEKARVARALSDKINDIVYQLQFMAKGSTRYDGFGNRYYDTMKEAKAALERHNSDKEVFVPFKVSLCGKYFYCKPDVRNS